MSQHNLKGNRSNKALQLIGQSTITVQDIQHSVGLTDKSSLLSKTIQFIRKSSMPHTQPSIDKIIHDQRNLILSHPNKVKLACIEKDNANKLVLMEVRQLEEEAKQEIKRKIEDREHARMERLKKIKREKDDKKGDSITKLFREMNIAKDEQIEVPHDVQDGFHQKQEAKKDQDNALFTLTEYQLEKKKDQKAKKDSDNSNYDYYAFRDMIMKIQDNHKQPIKSTLIGIEKTPIYQLQQLEGEQSNNKKNDFLTRLKKGEFIYKGKTNKLNLQNMYNELDLLKSYKPRIEKVDPENENLLSHKLWKALDDAAILWGQRPEKLTKKRNYSADSVDSFERSMDKMIEQQEETTQKQDTRVQKGEKFIYSKFHRKIRLS